jgi:transcriptional regulator with XRE-family HTH domain
MERAQLDRGYVSQIENGQRNVSLLVIAQIASAFSVEIADLFVLGDRD